MKESFPQFSTRYGDSWLSFHRQDLHNGLLTAATSPDSQANPPAKLNLGAAITTVEPVAGRITLASGKRIHKDLLIVANGVRTTLQSTVIGYDNPLIVAPKSIYRCLVPMSDVLNDPATQPLVVNEAPSLLTLKLDESAICASYPVRSNSILSISYVHPTKESERGIVDWNTPATHADIEESFPEHHSAVRALPSKAIGKEHGITCYPVVTRREVPTFVNGRTLLLGDAAHPMFTFHGQGASMAIESCGALEVFFKGISNPDLIPSRLNLFNKFRHGRCVATQLMSNGSATALRNEDILRRIRRYYDGPLPPSDTKPWGEGFRDFFFGYNVFEESKSFLEVHGIEANLDGSKNMLWYMLYPIMRSTSRWEAWWKQPALSVFAWFPFSYVSVLARIRGSPKLRDCDV